MAIAVTATRNTLATAYGSAGSWIGVATADPGTSSAPSSEASGGSPAYARKQTTWGTASGGAITGSAVTVDLPAGTYGFIILASAVSGSTMTDKAAITSTVLSAQGQLIVTPTYTQS